MQEVDNKGCSTWAMNLIFSTLTQIFGNRYIMFVLKKYQPRVFLFFFDSEVYSVKDLGATRDRGLHSKRHSL